MKLSLFLTLIFFSLNIFASEDDLKKWLDSCPDAQQLFARAGIDINSAPSQFDAAAYRALKIKFNNSPERKAITLLESNWWRYDSLLQKMQAGANFQGADRPALQSFINAELKNAKVEDRNNLVALQSRLWNKPVKGPMQSITNEQIITYLKTKKQSLQNQIIPLKQAFEASSTASKTNNQFRSMEAGAPKGIGMSLQYMEEAGNQGIKSAKTYSGRKPLTLFRDSKGQVVGYQIVTGVVSGKTIFADVTLKDQCQVSSVHMNSVDNSTFRRISFSAKDCNDASSGNDIPTRYSACQLLFGIKAQGGTYPNSDELAPTEQ